jgi:outer membrane protein TolC
VRSNRIRGWIPFAVLEVLAAGVPAAAQQAGSPVVPVRPSSHAEMEAREDPGTMLEFAGEEAPPLGRLLQLARERSPRLTELAARAAAAEARVGPAGTLEDPMLETRLAHSGLSRWTVGEEEMSMIEVGVRQDVPWPGLRGARRGLAEAEAAVAEVDLLRAERELERDVATIYGRLHALDREVRLFDDAHELMALLEATVSSRYGVGETDLEGVLKVSIATGRHDARREEVARERDLLAADLRRLLALPERTPVRRVAKLPELAPPPAEPARRAAAEAPAVVAAQARLLVAERRLEIARLGLKPGLAVSGGLGYRGKLDPMVYLGVGVELPLWRRQRREPLVRAAEQELAAETAAEHGASSAASAEAGALAASWRRLARQIELYDQAVLPQTSAALDAARSAYLAGRGDFSTVLEDFTLWLEARTERARLDGERFAVRAAMTALVGSDPASQVEGAQP